MTVLGKISLSIVNETRVRPKAELAQVATNRIEYLQFETGPFCHLCAALSRLSHRVRQAYTCRAELYYRVTADPLRNPEKANVTDCACRQGGLELAGE